MKSKKMSVHRSVLLNEAIEGLNLDSGKAVIDATFGGGGHSLEICRRYKGVKIIALDQDKSVFSRVDAAGCNISFVNENFRNIDKVLSAEGERVDGIIFDLGLSSDQLENSGRGFTFMKDEPLLMTMKENPMPDDLTAGEILNNWSEKNLANIIYGYGEEKFSRRIARRIVEAREVKKIETTFDLVRIIESAVPAARKRGRLHPSTRTFQAIRIAVNDELGALSEGLSKGFELLNKGGRIAVITFHSLEDRIVKRYFKKEKEEGRAILINKKPITASAEEIKNNVRARSAKLRIIEKIK